jgi:hypothetical protein
MRRIPLLLTLLVVAAAPQRAAAYGPGVHVGEGTRLLELLLEEDPTWLAPASEELALSYLRLGAISPDLQWATEHLGFGHSKSLSHALLAASENAGPLERMFALGHLSHVVSDASAEVFLAPMIFASQPLGPYDLFEGDDSPRAESEKITEGYGDFILGDWPGVIDLLFDFHVDGEVAKGRFAEIFTWYCDEGVANGGTASCPDALAEIENLLAQGGGLVSGMTRESAKEFILSLIDQPLEDVFALFTSGLFDSIIGGLTTPGEHADYFTELFLNGPLVEQPTWDLYDEWFFDLGPRMALDHLAYQITGWPEWDGDSLTCGNVQSMMQFLPERYTPRPELRINGLSWHDPSGATIAEATPDLDGKTLTATVTLFASQIFEGEVRGFVRRDHPGYDDASDEIVGEATVSMDVNPHEYSMVPRTELVISFVADHADVLGYYVELHAGEDEQPWLTTSWDRLWMIDALELDRPIYRKHFGTYGHWPPSLPVEEPTDLPGNLHVKATMAPGDRGAAGVLITLEPHGLTHTTGANGIAIFDGIPPGPVTLTAEHALGDAPSNVAVEPGGETWAWIATRPPPAPELTFTPWSADPRCVVFTWNTLGWNTAAETFSATLFDAEKGALSAPEDVGVEGKGTVCVEEDLADGARVQVGLEALHLDGAAGPMGFSQLTTVDASPPEIAAIPANPASPECVEKRLDPRQWSITIEALDDVSGIDTLAWRIADEEIWATIEVPESGDALVQGSAVAGTVIEIQAINGAGLGATATWTVPAPPLCDDDAQAGSGAGGCRAPVGGVPGLLAWLAFGGMWWSWRRRGLHGLR